MKSTSLGDVTTYSIKRRPHCKITVVDFASPVTKGISILDFIESLPNILAGSELRAIIDSIVSAHRNRKPVIAMMGGHVVKCGLGPVIISLMENNVLTGLAVNGSVLIHDFEIAMFGKTSEVVDELLVEGGWGMWTETSVLNDIEDGSGLGWNAARLAANGRYKKLSILARAYELDIPVSAHIAYGTDVVHFHPNAFGAVIGKAAQIDLELFISQVAQISAGGVVLNFGSAVILPEVFIKAVNAARNLGHDVCGFITADFDMIQHYRPSVNVVERARVLDGKGYSITGRHEIMIPLLAHAIIARL